MKPVLALGGIVGAVYYLAYRRKQELVDKLNLTYFRPEEFGSSLPLMDTRLLLALDAFRAALKKPITVSPAVGALLRPWAPGSEHFYGRAADIMFPQGPSLARAYETALELRLFSGLGVYPDWKPYPGMHVDVRPTRDPSDPARWAGVQRDGKQIYVGIGEGLT